jgi:hypothetical protein
MGELERRRAAQGADRRELTIGSGGKKGCQREKGFVGGPRAG